MDKNRVRGGSSWGKEIEESLDAADYVLALLTPGSYGSEICRAEHLRALRKSKCVIPLLAESGAEIPLHLEPKRNLDFTSESSYGRTFSPLPEDIHANNGITLAKEFPTTMLRRLLYLSILFRETMRWRHYAKQELLTAMAFTSQSPA